MIRSVVKVFRRLVEMCRRFLASKIKTEGRSNKGLHHSKRAREQIKPTGEHFFEPSACLLLRPSVLFFDARNLRHSSTSLRNTLTTLRINENTLRMLLRGLRILLRSLRNTLRRLRNTSKRPRHRKRTVPDAKQPPRHGKNFISGS